MGGGNQMRIGMAMLSTTGGSSVVATHLAAALRERDLSVRLLHCDERASATAASEALDSAELTALSTEDSRYLQRALDVDRAFCGAVDLCAQLLAWYRRAPFELLHLHNVHVFGVAALMLKRVHGVPFAVTFHGSDALDERVMSRNAPVVRAVLAEAGAVSCVSRYLAAAVARVQEPAPRVIYNFLPAGFGHAAAPATATAPAATVTVTVTATASATAPAAPAPRILHVSSLRAVKRPELLLAAFAAFRRREPRATLRIATTGHGARRAAELPLARQLGSALTLVDTEAQPQLLHDEYRRASALLLTSRYESFGLVILEALAHGAAVVAPALGGIPEVLGADWPFLVEDVDDPAAYAAALALACAPKRAAARRRALAATPAILRRFSAEAAVVDYLQLYRDALRAPLGAPRLAHPGAM